MRLSALLLVALLAPAASPAGAADPAPDPGKLRPAICGKRTSCSIASLLPAGRSESGQGLTVAAVTLGFADRPEEGPAEGCRRADDEEGFDGGQEYWLLEGQRAPRLLLQLCNDGYGAAGIGGDQVDVTDNRLVHLQYGGSNDRWEDTESVQLSPQRTLGVESCSYRATEAGQTLLTRIDVPNVAAHSLATDDAAAGEDDQGGDQDCDSLRKAMDQSLAPRPGLLAGQNVPLPQIADEAASPPDFPDGTVLGGCASAMASDGGYPVYGSPDGARRAELRFVALDQKTVVIQVAEPRADAGPAKSWVGTDHVEIWTSDDFTGRHRPDPAHLGQIAVGLDGKAWRGVGKAKLPTVARWTGRDAAGRAVTVLKLTWPGEDALLGGAIIAYSQAEAGRQARLVATAPIARNRPSFLPGLAGLPVSCGAVGGRWEITANPGLLRGLAGAE
jgi:hypothetical protein